MEENPNTEVKISPESEQPSMSRRIIFSVFLLGLAGQFAWSVENQYYNVFLYNYIAPNPFYVSLIVFTSAIASTTTAILIGALSDKIGRRKLFMIIGFIFWPIMTALFPTASFFGGVESQVAMAVIFDCVMTFFGGMATDVALNAYITDTTTDKNRGKLSSVLEIVTLIAILFVYGGSGIIINMIGWFNFFYLIAGMTALIGWIGLLLVKEPKISPSTKSYSHILKGMFNFKELRSNKDFFLVMLGCMLWAIAFNVFFPYCIIYLQHSLGLDIATSSILIGVALLAAIFSAYPFGKLVDKIGRKKVAIGAILLEAISLILFSFARDIVFVALAAIGWLIAMVGFDVSSRTWYKDLSPEDKRAQFNGFFILFTVMIGMSIGPFIGSSLASQYGEPIIIDNMPGYVPPSLIFLVAGFMMLLTFIPILAAKEYSKK